jgi:hypothetical protein
MFSGALSWKAPALSAQVAQGALKSLRILPVGSIRNILLQNEPDNCEGGD